MQDKLRFREILNNICQEAEEKGNILTLDEIEESFSEMELEKGQLSLVYDYLSSKKIVIAEYHLETEAGVTDTVQKDFDHKMYSDTMDNDEVINYRKKDKINNKIINNQTNNNKFNDTKLNKKAEGAEEGNKGLIAYASSAWEDSGGRNVSVFNEAEETDFLQMYLEDLRTIKPPEEGELEVLLSRITEDDSYARMRLTELSLQTVYELAGEYNNRGAAASDLIQEGNVALMTAIDMSDEAAADYQSYIESAIRASMEAVIDELDDRKKLADEILTRVNHMNEGVKNLSEDLGRNATVREVADYLEMSEEEVYSILKLAGEEIEVEGSASHHSSE